MAVLLFGLAGVIGRYVQSTALVVTFARVLISSLSLGTFFLFRRRSVALHSKSDAGWYVVAGMVMAAHWTLFMASVQTAGVAIGTITFATFPLFVTFLEPLCFHEHLRASGVVQAVIMLLGVLVLTPIGHPDSQLAMGILYGMGSSLTYAILSLINRRMAAHYDSTVTCFYEQSLATIVLLPVLLIARPPIVVADLPYLFFLGLFCTAVAHTLFVGALSQIKVRTAGIISGMESVYGILLACLLLGEFPTLREVIGGTVILTVAVYATLKR